jgi:hypothetical protein
MDRGLGDFAETWGQSDGQPEHQEEPHEPGRIPRQAWPRNPSGSAGPSRLIGDSLLFASKMGAEPARVRFALMGGFASSTGLQTNSLGQHLMLSP